MAYRPEWRENDWYEKARASAEKNAQFVRDMIRYSLEGLVRFSGKTVDRLKDELINVHRERLAAVPDLKMYPELEGMRGLIEAQNRGTQEGAGLSDGELAVHCNNRFYIHRNLRGGLLLEDKCTWIHYPTSDRGELFGNNLDSGRGEPFQIPSPMKPLRKGQLFTGGVSSGVFLDEVPPEIFPVPMGFLVSELCHTTDEAIELYTRYNYFHGPGNTLIVDSEGHAAAMEKTACRIGVRRSPDGFAFTTGMAAGDPELRAFLWDRRLASVRARRLSDDCADVAYWRAAEGKHRVLKQWLDQARKSATFDRLRQTLHDHTSTIGHVAFAGEKVHPDQTAANWTLRTSIHAVDEGTVTCWCVKGDQPVWEDTATVVSAH